MIYTITLNPSIDYFVEVKGPMMDTEVNRADREKFKGGGKGLNVSMVLDELKIPSTAIALLGGFTGNFIREYVENRKYITLKSIPVEGMNRINVKIYNDDQTLCINGFGPIANDDTISRMFAILQQVEQDDWVMLNGSSIQNLDFEFLLKIADLVHRKHAKLVVDMERLTLDQMKLLQPYLIKPNLYEFSLLLNQDVQEQDIQAHIQTVLQSGVETMLISLGEQGAIYASQTECIRLKHKAIHAVNKVGSGDAMLAAFVGFLSLGKSTEEALKWAGASGNASVSTQEDITYGMIQSFLDQMQIVSLSS